MLIILKEIYEFNYQFKGKYFAVSIGANWYFLFDEELVIRDV